MEFAEEVREFLIESNENLGVLDQEIVELEKNPEDEKLIASVFRTIHTIKGTCGFFGFEILGSITHVAENILGQVREKQRALTPELVSLVLQTVDVVKLVLGNIEERGEEGEDVYQDLRQRLDDAYQFRTGSEPLIEAEEPLIMAGNPEAAESLPSFEVVPPEGGEVEAEGTAPTLSSPPPVPAPEAVEARSAAPANSTANAAPTGSAVGSTIRVDVTLLDKLMNLVGELVLARNQILQGNANQTGTSSGASQRLNLITSELQEGVMRTRMQPIGVIWNKLPRVVRDLASEVGKQIDIQMEGAETELDKTIIEAIKDPLTHIVRNSCDHGIEKAEVRTARGKSAAGTITLRAYHEGGHVNIEISDDGAGIDPERVKRKAVEKGLVRPEQAAQMPEWEALYLIFLPGFSTAEKVTSISGRGVGMDVVKTNIEKIGGAVDLFNRPEKGSTVKIKIPLTLAIIPGLIVTLNSPHLDAGTGLKREDRFVIPQANLLELIRLEGAEDRKQIVSIQGSEVYRRRGKLLPLTYLSRVLGLPATERDDDVLNIVIVQAEDTAFGLVVDAVSDTQEIVVKALGKQLKGLSCYVGATIMGDGKIALILDVAGLARLANILPQPLSRSRVEARSAEPRTDTQTLLLFSAGRFPRLVVPLSMVARLEEFPVSRIEYASGKPVLHYRGAILPLISMSSLLDGSSLELAVDRQSVQVIVFSEGRRNVGMVVDQILDITEEAIEVKRAGASPGLLGSVVMAGQVTDMVDLSALLEAADRDGATHLTAAPEEARTILIVDPSRMSCGILHSSLELSGHRVLRSSSVEEALDTLGRTAVDVVVTAMRLGGANGRDLVGAMRKRSSPIRVPVVALAESSFELHSPEFDGCVMKTDREGLLERIRALAETTPDAEAAGLAVTR